MSFTLASPLMLSALALGAPVIAVYIFHRRPREREVSSLLLWQGLVQPGGAGRQREQLRAPWLLALELLAIALLALAAAQPLLTSRVSGRSVIIILDDSASMTATDASGESPRDRAASEIDRVLDAYASSRTAFVLAASSPSLLSASTEGAPRSADALSAWTCRAAEADLLGAIRLALELASESTDIIALTDHAPPPDTDYGPRVRWLAFGEPLPNAAITGAARSTGGTPSAVIEVTNHADQHARRQLSIEREGAAPLTRDLTIEPGATSRYRIPVDETAEVTLRLTPPDALPADDVVLLVPEDTRPVSVLVRTTDDTLRAAADRWISADPGVGVSTLSQPELLITDDEAGAPAGAWTIRIRRPTTDAARPYSGPYVINRQHELAEGLDLAGLLWSADLEEPAGTPSDPGLAGSDPVVTLANRTIVEQNRFSNGRREIGIFIDPEYSNLFSQVAWPVLLSNAARLRRDARPGPSSTNVRAGHPVRISAPFGSEDPIIMIDPDNNQRTITAASADYTPPVPGRYTIRTGDTSYTLAANLLAPSESDLRAAARSRTEPAAREDTDPSLSTRNMAWLLAIVAAVALAVHAFVVSATYRRGETV